MKKTTCSGYQEHRSSGTQKNHYSNGVSSRSDKGVDICGFGYASASIRAGKDLMEHFSQPMCYKFLGGLWQKTRTNIRDSGKQKRGIVATKGAWCKRNGQRTPCRITSLLFIRGGVPGKLPAQQPQKKCVPTLPTFRYRGEIYEKPNYCK